MYKLFLIAFLSLSLYAQEKKEYINEVSFLIGDSENGFNQNINRSLAYDIQFQYDGLDFPIRPEISFIYSQNISLYDDATNSHTRYVSIMGNGVYDIPYTKLLNPYVKAGVGYQSFSDVPKSPPSSPFADVGGGLKLHISKRWALKFEALLTVGKEHTNLLALGGLNFKFGRKYVERPPEKECEVCPKVIQLAAPAPVSVSVTKTPIKLFSPHKIRFEYAKATLTDDSKASLKNAAESLNSTENRAKKITIVGNTDDKGSRAFNATLSIKRANAVRTQLVQDGVNPKRITIEGLGEINPVADNTTALGREKNRRVIILLTNEY